LNVPVTVGVPLIVIVLFAQVAVNPAGKPVAVPIPVAPVVVAVIAGDNASFTQVDRGAGAVVVLINTVIVPVALTVPHPPVSGIV
jgi:hypothetical protein